jgi:transcriptional antiterminator RfaH
MNISTSTGRSWYLIMAKPRQEMLARDNLERQGYEVYLPRLHVRRRRNGKYVLVVEPMFPRYFFIRLDKGEDNWAPIRSTYGVSKMVYFGFEPARIADELVDSIKSHDDEHGIQEIAVKELSSGDKIRVIDGVMSGYEGIFQAKTGKERVTILLQYADKSTPVEVSVDHVERVS